MGFWIFVLVEDELEDLQAHILVRLSNGLAFLWIDVIWPTLIH